MMMSGGRPSIRGYLVQTLIAILDALDGDHPWDCLHLEPADEVSQKIDLLWEHSGRRRAVQVKSSQNQINRADAEGWAQELATHHSGVEELELVLVGPCAQSVLELGAVGRVVIRPPKPPDLRGMVREAAHCLARFLESRCWNCGRAEWRERLVEALVGRLVALSANGGVLGRKELARLLEDWITLDTRAIMVSVPEEILTDGEEQLTHLFLGITELLKLSGEVRIVTNKSRAE